jgi:Uma2 family endonuclease
MNVFEKFTSADLELMPDDGKRYEIIEGELYVSRAPGYEHQYTCTKLLRYLDEWNDRNNLGIVLSAPGLVFADDDDVIPDLIWISRKRFASGPDRGGHLMVAPELVVEVLSPGKHNEDRDREAKLKLYSRRGVQEYWIVNWMAQQVEVYRREGGRLKQTETLLSQETIESPLLEGFSCPVKSIFFTHQ